MPHPGDNPLGELLGNVDQRKVIRNLDGAERGGQHARLAGDGTDEIGGTNAGPARPDEAMARSVTRSMPAGARPRARGGRFRAHR